MREGNLGRHPLVMATRLYLVNLLVQMTWFLIWYWSPGCTHLPIDGHEARRSSSQARTAYQAQQVAEILPCLRLGISHGEHLKADSFAIAAAAWRPHAQQGCHVRAPGPYNHSLLPTSSCSQDLINLRACPELGCFRQVQVQLHYGCIACIGSSTFDRRV